MSPLASRLCVAAFAVLVPSLASASERHFAFSYETQTMPKGTWEFEPMATLKHYTDKEVFDFRFEVEYGVTDSFQLAAYLSNFRYTNLDHGKSESEWQHVGLEAIYSLSDPNTDWIGSALYGEVLIGPEKFSLESKLLLQKNFGPVALVYNAVIEAEWEGPDYNERVGVWENTFGLCYNFSPSFSVGVEATHELEFADWSDAGDHVVFVGPNLSWRGKLFYATAAGLFQATNVDGEPEAQVRLLVGFDF